MGAGGGARGIGRRRCPARLRAGTTGFQRAHSGRGRRAPVHGRSYRPVGLGGGLSMKRWVPWALLAVSVALNIFVLAGFFWSRHAAYGFHDAAWRMAHASSYIADRLQLTPAQRTDLDRVMGEIRSRFEQARS